MSSLLVTILILLVIFMVGGLCYIIVTSPRALYATWGAITSSESNTLTRETNDINGIPNAGPEGPDSGAAAPSS